MTVNQNFSCDDEDILDDGNASDVGLLTLPLPDDASTLEDAAAGTAESSPSEVAEHAGARCIHCDTPMPTGETFCRRCGFYPAIKTFVEVEAEEDGQELLAAQPARSHWEVWKSLVPRWGWALIAGVAVLLALSVAARLLVPAGEPRATWTYAQFAAGAVAIIVAHIACYMFAIMQDDSLSFIDIVLKPFVIWAPTLQELPKSFKRAALGGWGLAAALFAALVVAGVRYDEIVDWGKVPPKKPKKTVVVPIDSAGDDKSMEEALDEFTKNAGVVPGDSKERQKQKGNGQKMARCLIVGFTPNRESDFGLLILAVEEGGKWRFAGVVDEGIPIEVRSLLNRRMRMYLRSTPVVPCDLQAFWLEPRLMCTVWYEDWTAEQRLNRPFFEKLQPDFEPRRGAGGP